MSDPENSNGVEAARWYLVGAGRIGCLAAYYLHMAGIPVTAVRPGRPHGPMIPLDFVDEAPRYRAVLNLDVKSPDCLEGPVSRLLIASKTPYTESSLSRVSLSDDAVIVRLQNGLSDLQNHLKPRQRLIEGVTSSAVMGSVSDRLRVVAQNRTFLGGGRKPVWFDRWASAWPGLTWKADIREAQWRKLVANALINPLTALHDVPNGALLEQPALERCMRQLAAEADRVLDALDPTRMWNAFEVTCDVIRATTDNTSSMRADAQRGVKTEIRSINGWLLRQADRLGLDLPGHREIMDRIIRLTEGARPVSSQGQGQ